VLTEWLDDSDFGFRFRRAWTPCKNKKNIVRRHRRNISIPTAGSTQSGKFGILLMGPNENKTARARTPHSMTLFPLLALAIRQSARPYAPVTSRALKIGRMTNAVCKVDLFPQSLARGRVMLALKCPYPRPGKDRKYHGRLRFPKTLRMSSARRFRLWLRSGFRPRSWWLRRFHWQWNSAAPAHQCRQGQLRWCKRRLRRIKAIGHVIGGIQPWINRGNAKQVLAEFQQADV
jgi:hypothetical protein